MKNTIAHIAGLLLVLGVFITANVQSQNEPDPPSNLSQEEKRYDLNNDGQLSADEKEIRIQVIAFETFSDTQLSEREIREMYGEQSDGFGRRGGGFPGRGDRSRGRGGFRGFGFGGGSTRRLNPDELEFHDGVATIPDRATFKKLSYQGTEVLIDTYLAGLEYVKFNIENAGTDEAQVYFINTKTHRGHPMFMRAIGLSRGGNERMRGVLIYRPFTKAPSGEFGVYTFEFEPNDAYPFKMIQIAHDLLVAKMPLLKNRLGYCPLWGAINIYIREKALYNAAAFPVYFEDDLYADIAYLPLNLAESFGRLRLMDVNDRPTPRDIVLYKTLPNEMPRVAGIITGVRQTPLSHVNLRAIQDKVPNAFITEAWENRTIAPLIGKYVYYKVDADGFELRAATSEEVEAHFADLRPAKPQIPIRDLSVTEIRPLNDIKFSDSSQFGVKTANVATLRTFGFAEGTVPDGFGMPFYFYDEFMKHNDFYAYAEALLKDSAFQKDPDTKASKLKKFRERIEDGEMPAWMMDAISDLQKSFPDSISIRCRSSTNNEDLPGFSGAGLYDSFTHNPDEGHLSKSIKQVFASLWNFRAFEARDFYRIDHFATAMGVLLHPNFAGELANGVAVTDDILYQTEGNYYLNTQVGEDLVTNPESESVPEEILLDWLDNDNYRVVTASNRVTEGKQILTGEHLRQLSSYLDTIHNKFSRLYNATAGAEKFVMEIEFKITRDGKLAIKQARPWVY